MGRRRLRGRSRALSVVALGAVAVVAASGCDSAEHAGAAATVGDTRIALDTVRDVTAQIDVGQFAQSTTTAAVQRTVVDRLVSRQLDVRLAGTLGVPLPTKDQVDAAYQTDATRNGGDAQFRALAASQGYAGGELLAEIEGELLGQTLDAKLVAQQPPTTAQLQALYAQYKDQLQGATFAQVAQTLAEQVYAPALRVKAEQKLAGSVGVHVNSRFGSWSPSQGQVVDDLAPLSSTGRVLAPQVSGTLTTP